jgi:hypothetical protein
MSRTSVENVECLLDLVDGIGYTILFVLLAICARWILRMVEDGVRPRRKLQHRFVHPFPSPTDFGTKNHPIGLSTPDTAKQTGSIEERTTLCA